MKKKRGPIFGIIILLLLVAVNVGRVYYQDRYVPSDYYTVVPQSMDLTPETMKSDSGEDLGKGKELKFIAFDKDGKKKEVEFDVHLKGSGIAGERDLPKHGDYLLIKASEKMVNNWDTIEKSKVPKKALEQIEKNSK